MMDSERDANEGVRTCWEATLLLLGGGGGTVALETADVAALVVGTGICTTGRLKLRGDKSIASKEKEWVVEESDMAIVVWYLSVC